MSKKIYRVFSLLLLSGCAPYINAANKNMVTVYVPNTTYESEALALADQHCARYGMTAMLRKPRAASTVGDLYDYRCVK
ncbi:MAG: hypothetical protein A3J37_04150 [Alphaproteobacteria bacterium RIFCSPHIGHO2_12_FULL_45_9]|nr:MAG: hypothetical protein A3B66_08240 [Alphaproteobacteria bacterium RIFCSPHIGHO2_02_FULL_46_13]OFW95878.1 MAG: hypothetical protein A3J37_04150 [Alphaproteobacteria bacterium RIFCSPHIGHO2_12_FULL_45_9]